MNKFACEQWFRTFHFSIRVLMGTPSVEKTATGWGGRGLGNVYGGLALAAAHACEA